MKHPDLIIMVDGDGAMQIMHGSHRLPKGSVIEIRDYGFGQGFARDLHEIERIPNGEIRKDYEGDEYTHVTLVVSNDVPAKAGTLPHPAPPCEAAGIVAALLEQITQMSGLFDFVEDDTFNAVVKEARTFLTRRQAHSEPSPLPFDVLDFLLTVSTGNTEPDELENQAEVLRRKYLHVPA